MVTRWKELFQVSWVQLMSCSFQRTGSWSTSNSCVDIGISWVLINSFQQLFKQQKLYIKGFKLSILWLIIIQSRWRQQETKANKNRVCLMIAQNYQFIFLISVDTVVLNLRLILNREKAQEKLANISYFCMKNDFDFILQLWVFFQRKHILK